MKLDLKSKFDHLPSDVILSHLFYLTTMVCLFFVSNGLVDDERDIALILEPDHQIIQTQSDKRRGSNFLSTPNFYLSLKNLVPDVSIFLQSETMVDFEVSEGKEVKPVRRTTDIMLVDDTFFQAIQGSMLSGESFQREEILSGAPVAILTEGLVRDTFGQEAPPSSLVINGRQFLIKGVFAMKSSQIRENFSLILPLSAVSILGQRDKTYLSKFILKGNSSHALEKLKAAIDKIQLDSGQVPVRPEFTMLEMNLSEKFQGIMDHQKVYLNIFLWVLFFYAVLRFQLDFSDRFFLHRDWITFRLMAGLGPEEITRELRGQLLLLFLTALGLSIGISGVALAILHFIFDVRLSFGTDLHLSALLYLGNLIFSWVLISFRIQQCLQRVEFASSRRG